MEHKLIRGGDEYLSFARSRVKALRATGLSYASQQFEINGVSVKVRISGEHDFITLKGGSGTVLSGMVRGGVLEFNLDPANNQKVLRSFKPTKQTWLDVMKKKPVGAGPSVFSDSKQLAVSTSAELLLPYEIGSQNRDIVSSMYSGRMAAAVQFLQGCGKLPNAIDPDVVEDGIQITYDYRFDKSHGITTSASGDPWLVEISRINGVLAMPLPVFANKEVDPDSKIDAVRECKKLFKAIPSGKNFPSGAALTEAIADGSILQLLTPLQAEAMYLEKTSASDTTGWSFNDAGSEAHNVVFYNEGTFFERTGLWAEHLMLRIVIGETAKNRAPGQAIATATAEIVSVEKKIRVGQPAFYVDRGQDPNNSGVSHITAPSQRQGSINLDGSIFYNNPPSPFEYLYPFEYPLFVCHVNDKAHVVRSKTIKLFVEGSYLNGFGEPEWRPYTRGVSDEYPGEEYFTQGYEPIINNPGSQIIFAPAKTRDCYIVVGQYSRTFVVTSDGLQQTTLYDEGNRKITMVLPDGKRLGTDRLGNRFKNVRSLSSFESLYSFPAEPVFLSSSIGFRVVVSRFGKTKPVVHTNIKDNTTSEYVSDGFDDQQGPLAELFYSFVGYT